MNFTGIVVAVVTFLIIGLFHPVVIKAEYYWGTKCWWVFLVVGVATIIGSLFVANLYASRVMGVWGISCWWSILEIYYQKKRV